MQMSRLSEKRPKRNKQMNKCVNRLRRAKRGRSKIRELGAYRLSVTRTSKHTYAQIFDSNGAHVLASASSLEKELRAQIPYGGNIAAAVIVGKEIALRAQKIGIDKIAFDRSGYRYHGRLKALADAAREYGLKF